MRDKVIVVKVPEDTAMEEYEEIKQMLKRNPSSLIVPANFEVQVVNSRAMVEYELQRQQSKKKVNYQEMSKYTIIGWTIIAILLLANLVLEALFL